MPWRVLLEARLDNGSPLRTWQTARRVIRRVKEVGLLIAMSFPLEGAQVGVERFCEERRH
jgi:hypothetical protein